MLELRTNFLLYCHLDMLADTFTVYISYPQNVSVAVCCNFAPVKIWPGGNFFTVLQSCQ